MKYEILDDFSVDEYEKELYEECKLKNIPAIGYIELTPLCNFDCKMCYIHLTPEQMNKNGKMMTKHQVIRIVREAVEMGLYTVSLTGGEIFTRRDFKEIYETVYDMGVLISLRTNGYAINDEIVEWLKVRPPRFIQISLYGGSNETYENVCGIKDGYDVVISNINKLINAKLTVCLGYTIIQENSEEYKKMMQWAKKRKIPFEGHSGILRADTRTERKVENLRLKLKPVPMEVPNDAVIYMDDHNFDINNPFSICRNYGCQFTLKWNGMLGICVSMKSVDVDVTDKPFAEAYRLLYENTEKIKHPKKCITCKYVEFCDACPSRLEAETGDPEGISEYICENAKWEHDMCWCELQKQEAKKNEGKE